MHYVIQQQNYSRWHLIGLLSAFIVSVDCFVSVRLQGRRSRGARYLISTNPSHATNFDIFQLSEDEKTEEIPVSKEKEAYYSLPHSKNQLMSIQSTSPAVLLKSGPGTGKTHTLASRVAYLLKTEACPPERMVIMSFSNNDVELLKTKALDLFEEAVPCSNSSSLLSRKQVSERLWSGTIHRFSINIIRACNKKSSHIRVVSSEEAAARINRCLHQVLDEDFHRRQGPYWNQNLKKARLTNRDALIELRQSRSVLIHQIGRCMELWKESSIVPPPPFNEIDNKARSCMFSATESRENCMELATRLGISRNVAYLAWTIFPMLQDLHARQRTADPADLASIAFNLLLACPQQLSKLRKKLRHVILDEYQDVSVSQHALIRLIIRGVVDELSSTKSKPCSKSHLQLPPVLIATEDKASSKYSLDFDVPCLFCAGDSQQSIYGFRGAAPKLSIDGFRKDFPQGVIAEIETNFRLPTAICSLANSLIGNPPIKSMSTFQESPVGISRIRKKLRESLHRSSPDTDTASLTDIISERFTDDLTNSMHIQGLWDEREEAKHIANMIKRRSKERLKVLTQAIKDIGHTPKNTTITPIEDPTTVAVIVRGVNQMTLIKEALDKAKIPYEGNRRQISSSKPQVQNLQMRSVALITMHGSKGEEYDDIFLPGWTEGVFPHPSAVSNNRIDEERRLAFVALSRARHQVIITHSFMRRANHNGPNLRSKKVTMQVRPSRFLYELVPNGMYTTDNYIDNYEVSEHSQNDKQLPIITWDRSLGSKGSFAGSNLPAYFQKTYQVPRDFTPPEHPEQEVMIIDRQFELIKKQHHYQKRLQTSSKGGKTCATRSTCAPNTQKDVKQVLIPVKLNQKRLQTSRKGGKICVKCSACAPNTPKDLKQVLIPVKLEGDESELVFSNINDILKRKRGSAKKARVLFRELLESRFNLKRGRINLFSFEGEVKNMSSLNSATYDVLATSTGNVTTRPLSRATALQLGLFLAYSLRNVGSSTVK